MIKTANANFEHPANSMRSCVGNTATSLLWNHDSPNRVGVMVDMKRPKLANKKARSIRCPLPSVHVEMWHDALLE
jgi:hypothetical protein